MSEERSLAVIESGAVGSPKRPGLRVAGIARRALAAALLVAAGSSSAATVPSITLTPVGEQWRVEYTLDAPAKALRFARTDRQGNRARDWTPVDPMIELVLVDGEEVIRRRDDAPFAQASFDVPPRYRPLEKDYAPFSPFGDGGLLIHTGRFHACVDRCADDDSPVWTFAMTPPAGAHVIHGGTVHDASLEFTDRDSGTNIYVGTATPVATPDVVAVVDQTLPVAARDALEQLFPRLMALYVEEFGPLPSKPMLFASHDAAHPGGGYGYQGGTLPGQVFIHIYGRHEAFSSDDFQARMRWHFAHEAAHLFQRYDRQPVPDGESWIHEGGADAKAALALQRLGVLDTTALRERIEGALAQCSSGLAERPLHTSHDAGAFDNYYHCGLLLQLAADAAARRASDGTCDLFCIWRDFLAAVAGGAPWNVDTFATVVERRAGPDTAAFIRRVASEQLQAPQQALRVGLEAAGIELP